MTEPEMTDDQIRIELKRMIAQEKFRVIRAMDEVEDKISESEEIPADAKEKALREFRQKQEEANERFDRIFQKFIDFVDRR